MYVQYGYTVEELTILPDWFWWSYVPLQSNSACRFYFVRVHFIGKVKQIGGDAW